MLDFFKSLGNSISQLQIRDFIDIFFVAIVIYILLKFTSHTRASQVLKGLGIIIVVSYICRMLQLPTLSWVLNYVIEAGALLLVIIFQPEIRRALEKIGRGRIFEFSGRNGNAGMDDIDKLHRAILNLSMHKTGALIVFEQKTGLREVMESGVELNADISYELINNIFFKNSPLHDGAMIIKDGKIAAAGCFLPLSGNTQVSSELGTRHRAALGISEVSDSVTIVVSEETGVISSAKDGVLTRYIDSKLLKKLLEDIILDKHMQPIRIGFRKSSKGGENGEKHS